MHYVGGQKQATRVSKLIQTCTQKIKKLLVQYNQIQSQNGDDSQASVKDVCDLGSQFWVSKHSYVVTDPHENIPASNQRRLLELWHLDQVRIVLSYGDHLDLCISSIFEVLSEYHDATLLPLQTFDGNIYSCVSKQLIDCLPLKEAGLIAALLTTSQTLYQNLCRAEEVAKIVIQAYWAGDGKPEYIVQAKMLSGSFHLTFPLSICDSQVPRCSDEEIEELHELVQSDNDQSHSELSDIENISDISSCVDEDDSDL